jgi:hypothetical protein
VKQKKILKRQCGVKQTQSNLGKFIHSSPSAAIDLQHANKHRICSCQHQHGQHAWTYVPMQEAATQGQDLEARLSLKGLTLTRICSDILGFQACNATRGHGRKETSRAPDRDGVCPPKARRLMVLPGIVGTPEQNFWRVFDSPARTGETLSFSDWRRQELSPRAQFSRHCLL